MGLYWSLWSLVLLILAAATPGQANLRGSAHQHERPEKDSTDQCEPKLSDVPPERTKVAIIGGGISGAYVAWRLVSEVAPYTYNGSEVWIFERTDHIGGRFVSPTIGCHAGDDEARLPRAELGGMRIGSNNTMMLKVCKELGIELGPFYMRSTWSRDDPRSALSDDSSPFWARGLSSSKSEVDSLPPLEKELTGDGPAFSGSLPYFIPPAVESQRRRRSPEEFIGIDDIDNNDVLKSTPMIVDPCDGEANARIIERSVPPLDLPIWQHSSWDYAVATGRTQEEFAFSDALSGYAFSDYSFNLGHESPLIPPRLTTEYYLRPLRGMEEVPKRLWQNFSCGYGGGSVLNMELVRVVRRSSQQWPFELTFASTQTSPCSEITTRTSKIYRTLVKHVVLALPKAALNRVEFLDERALEDQLALQAVVQGISDAVLSVPLAKVFAAFSTRWWEEHNFTSGVFTSETSMNQVYPWYPGTQQSANHTPPSCNKDMGVLQLYPTKNVRNSWPGLTLQQQQMRCSVSEPNRCAECFNQSSGFLGDPLNHVTRQFVKFNQREYATVFGKLFDEIPEPYEVKYRIWDAEDPVTKSDAVHFWKSGFKWWEVYADALELQRGIYVVGEAFSYYQGWAEGALETAEYMLHEKMGMPLPEWLSQHEYCWLMPYYVGRRQNITTTTTTTVIATEAIRSR